MPKKKLTKAQVKRKLNSINSGVYDLVLDKMGHGDSFVPISTVKLIKLNADLNNAFKRVK